MTHNICPMAYMFFLFVIQSIKTAEFSNQKYTNKPTKIINQGSHQKKNCEPLSFLAVLWLECHKLVHYSEFGERSEKRGMLLSTAMSPRNQHSIKISILLSFTNDANKVGTRKPILKATHLKYPKKQPQEKTLTGTNIYWATGPSSV